MDFSKVIRKHIQNITPYATARDEYSGKIGIFLDANENPYKLVPGNDYNRYPDPYQYEVKVKLGLLKGVNHASIFLGNGSDEPIDLLIKAFCEPKEDNILIMPPTYGMYKVCADIQNVGVQVATLTEDFEIDLDNVFDAINAATKIVWVCSPNNPSGNLVSKAAIFQILKAFPDKIIVVDEAYIDFADSVSFIDSLNDYDNLVVLQTMSKAWGMAGLRLGMAFGHAEIIKMLTKIKYPYNLNLLSQQKMLEALDYVEQKNDFVKQILQEKEILTEALLKLKITEKIYPSDSNMLLVKFKEAPKVFLYLLENKIILRDRSNVILCENCLRISIGNAEENKALVDCLEKYL
jgi:histidinol-phosphate aminotransferase